jgi:hypothetical protein
MLNWNALRSMWVNGEQKEAEDAILELEPMELLLVIKQALLTSKRLNNQSGDLTDLFELLSAAMYREIH